MTFNLLTLKVVSESRVTWATYVPILVFLCLSVLDLGPMYATDVKTDRDAYRKTKIGTEVVHVTRNSDITLKVKRSKVNLQGTGYIRNAFCTYCRSI